MKTNAFVKALLIAASLAALSLIVRFEAQAAIFPVLTYLEEVDETSAGRTTSRQEIVRIDAAGRTSHSSVPLSPASPGSSASLAAAATAHDAHAQCSQLVTNFYPVAVQLPPGARLRSGTLNVAIDGQSVALPVNFAVTSLSGDLRRVFVYGDSDAPVAFTGALDLSQGVLMGASFTIATSPQRATRCRMNLVLPARPAAPSLNT